jgi:hypothetical protein
MAATYHLVMASILLSLMVLGFSQTFFLRPWVQTYEVAEYVLWHGAAMTAWFAWYWWQAWLVAGRRVWLHRRSGVVGVGIGLVAFASAVAVDFAMVVRGRRAGRDIAAEVAHYADVVWSNLAPLLVFFGFFSAALLLRRRSAAHGRLMLLGSIALLDPALARIGVLPSVELFGRDLNTLVFGIGMMVLLPLSLAVRDFYRDRRLHPATGFGVPALWLLMFLLRTVVPHTWAGQALILWFA